MARGPKKHMKRLAAPHHWMLSKMGGVYAPRPSTGPHKMRECVPLVVLLRNRLKYALTRREVIMIVMQRFIKIDGKVRTDSNYPAGYQDVLSIEKTNETYRLLYDSKGRFVLHRLSAEESNVKLLRVRAKAVGSKASIGKNPFVNGRTGSIPYIVTHDGRTIRYPDPNINIHDTVKFNFVENKIVEVYKFEPGNLAHVIRGNNVGRVGTIVSHEHHAASYDIIHLKDRIGNEFSTRLQNVFIIGNGSTSAISLPKNKGVRSTVIEEREKRLNKEEKKKSA
jgi:small subunit ribosomal protein S4e